MDEYITVKEAAKIRKVSIRRMQQFFKQGRYKSVKWCECGHAQMVLRSEVEGKK
jgi:hypothetical protein